MDFPSQPLLKKHKIDFAPDEAITHFAAGHNRVVVATKDKNLSIVDTSTSKQIDCDLSPFLGNKLHQARINRIFLDPTGRFILISLAYATDGQPLDNLLYVKRFQTLPRLKNYLISAVAWNYPKADNESDINSTGTILLGTTKGIILQAEFVHGDEGKFFPLTSGSRQYVKEVFDVGSELGAITGLEYHQIPSNSPNEKSFIIFIATNSRLYRMIGSVPANVDPAPLNLIFAQNATSYRDVPGRFNSSKLDIYYPGINQAPTRYAWLTEPGVITGDIHNDLLADREVFDSNTDMTTVPYESPEDIELPLSSSTPSGMSPPFSSAALHLFDRPLALVVTDFHVIVLFKHSIRAICILNNAIVYEEYFSGKYGNIQGMCKDPVKNTIWVYCERAIFRFKVMNESKNVWRIYLEQKRFDLAKKYCLNDEANYDRVLCEEAQDHFRSGDYEISAELFAKSKKPFEDIALMFMEIRCIKALRKYLVIKVEQFEHTNTIQLTMTLAWLLELIVSSISILKGDSDANRDKITILSNELESLFTNKKIVECVAQYSSLFYGIIRNYSDQETFLKLAQLIGDFERVVEYYMDMSEFDKALKLMKVMKNNDLFYKYGHVLMKRMPKELVDALMEQPSIVPAKLIPVLIQENPYYNKCSETIRYLEFCIKNLKMDSPVIYNHLFELYARRKDEDTLIKFLNNLVQLDGDGQCQLDIQLCLRLCTELKLDRACVALYSAMGLFDEALDLAIHFDLELAKSIANRAESEEHQKRLWLTISQRVLSKNPDIQIATSLLKECRLLKIEDILPFFPDYTTIDFFKNAIRQSLQEYKNQILSLKDGTYEKIADDIRGEIKTFRNRYSIIKIGQKCESCKGNLLSRSFYVFPCGHLFHSDCLIKEIISIDPYYKDIEEKLKQLTLDNKQVFIQNRQLNFLINSNSSQTRSQTDNRERLENDIDSIISSECLYCGSFLPSYIDKPPILTNELDEYL